jgi:hypothetical protein
MPPSSSFLPLTAPALTSTITRFNQATSSQLHRLHYKNTNPGAYVRSRRHLARLTKLGYIRRIQGVYDGPLEYIYLPPDSKARTANMHTLDITELYVQLVTSSPDESYIFDPEPSRFYSVGPTQLKPAGYIDSGRRYFLEVDRGTEYRAALAEKMRRYIVAYERWDEDRFPQVLFVCHDIDRKRFIEQVVKRQAEPALFKVALFSEYLEVVKG